MVTSREMGVGRGNAVVGDGAVQTLRCNISYRDVLHIGNTANTL